MAQQQELMRPFFTADFLARLVRDPTYNDGEQTTTASLFVEFVETVGDGDTGVRTRFGAFPFRAFGDAAVAMQEDALRQGDFIEIHGATVASQKKYSEGEEVKEEISGKPVFELYLFIDDRTGSYVQVYGADDVDEPEKPQRRNQGRRNARGRGGDDRGEGRDGDRGARGSNSRAASDRGSERGADRGAERGGSRGADRGSDREADRGDDRGRGTSRAPAGRDAERSGGSRGSGGGGAARSSSRGARG